MSVAEYCLSKPFSEETYPFGPDVTVFKARGKIFALTPAVDHPSTISLKCEPTRAIILRQEHSEITPGYHLSKRHWNTLNLVGDLPDSLIQELIDHSYLLVIN
jgi:predicted DNA-binding protein (MmcQ/YjbR family)